MGTVLSHYRKGNGIRLLVLYGYLSLLDFTLKLTVY